MIVKFPFLFLNKIFKHISHVYANTYTVLTYRSIMMQTEVGCTQVSRFPVGVYLLQFTINHTSKLMTMTTTFVCWRFYILRTLQIYTNKNISFSWSKYL